MRRQLASALLGIAALVGVSACGSTAPQSNSAAPTTATQPGATSPSSTNGRGSTATTSPATTPPSTSSQGTVVEEPEVDQMPEVPTNSTPVAVDPSTSESLSTFLRDKFNDIQSVWSEEFQRAGVTYVPATLQIFTGSVETACGSQGSEVGPFYCPSDRTVYLDQSFFSVMEHQFGVTGDFAPAYVVAHEMGHHVQALLGISTQVAQADQADPTGTNSRSVRVELQADCLAGVWAHSTDQRNLLKDGDLESALKAAAAVGDDFLAKTSGQPVEEDNFTHGTSAQRQHWLNVGFEKGTPNACDTFSGSI